MDKDEEERGMGTAGVTRTLGRRAGAKVEATLPGDENTLVVKKTAKRPAETTLLNIPYFSPGTVKTALRGCNDVVKNVSYFQRKVRMTAPKRLMPARMASSEELVKLSRIVFSPPPLA